MFVLPKRNILLPWAGGTIRLARGVMAAIPDQATETTYFKALAADCKIILSTAKDRDAQAADEKKVKTRRGKEVTEE